MPWAIGDQPVWLTAGWQDSHSFNGERLPLAMHDPMISQRPGATTQLFDDSLQTWHESKQGDPVPATQVPFRQ